MSKYKVGDKFLIEIQEVLTTQSDKNIYSIKGFETLTFNDDGLNKLERATNKTDIDWSQVAVDTPILVSDDKKDWFTRYFALYFDGKIYAWNYGDTSQSVDKGRMRNWEYVKLVN